MSAPSMVAPQWDSTVVLPRDTFGTSWDPVLEAVRAEASHAVSTPLGDAAVASALAGMCRMNIGQRTVAAPGRVQLRRRGAGWRVDAELPRIPWGRDAEHVLVVADGRALRLPTAAATVHPGANLAGEQRDTLTFTDHAAEPVDVSEQNATLPDRLTVLGALVRATAIAGALQTVCSLVIAHAGQREQFGRPLDRFQAVQAHLVTIATETASAEMAAEIGRRGIEESGCFSVAVAKTRAAAAATAAARAAHQVLGAVGTTELHELGSYTRRLWSWRDEHGTQVWWQRRLGELAAAEGSGGVWDLVTGVRR